MPRHHRPHNPEHADAVLRVVGADHIEHTIPGWTDALRERLSRDARRTEPTDLPRSSPPNQPPAPHPTPSPSS